MHYLALFTFLLSSPLFAQHQSEEIDYGNFSQELEYLEETAKNEDRKLLENVDKISEEKIESGEDLMANEKSDSVSTTTAAVEKAPAPFRPPAIKTRRIRSR